MSLCNPRDGSNCEWEAEFRATAMYLDGTCYPAAMFPGVCNAHLADVLLKDAAVGGSSRCWKVEVL